MVVVPRGGFVVGSSRGGVGQWKWGPPHRVNIGYAYAVGKYPVTFNEWDACVADGGCKGYTPYDEKWGRANHPVINVSWEDAQSYVAWLSRKTGHRYRLISEAEYEYAERAGNAGPYSTGESISLSDANFLDPVHPAPGAQGRTTMPVGSFPPNAFGLYDMQGNVWEWVQDCWHDDYGGRPPTDGSAWLTGDCQRRVVRAGSFNRDRSSMQSASRYWIVGQLRSALAGFRVARDLY